MKNEDMHAVVQACVDEKGCPFFGKDAWSAFVLPECHDKSPFLLILPSVSLLRMLQ